MRTLSPRAVLFAILAAACCAQAQTPHFLGFDRNLYPGDAALPALRKTFSFAGYWLSKPPGSNTNTWIGRRAILKQNGFGFLVLWAARPEGALGRTAAAMGAADGKAAVAAAKREGFDPDVIIFLDEEEGGRLTPPIAAYIFAWIDAVRAGGARPGVYCSAIMVTDTDGPISTAKDIAQREAERMKNNPATHPLALWLANDQCPPAPGCTVENLNIGAAFPPSAAVYAPVWQYAQSPRRKEFTAACPKNYAPDGYCYAPGLPQTPNSFVDLNLADSPDPSEQPRNGRSAHRPATP